MKIDLAAINTEEFTLKERDGLIKINPLKSKYVWKEDELYLRSLLCKPDGTVVSCGFPKFFNYGDYPEHDKKAKSLILSGRGSFTEKYDGSLIIRSIIDGKVNLRTRGNFDLGENDDTSDWHGEEVKKFIAKKYPKIFNCNINPPEYVISELFEYISPNNRIVVKYTKPMLVYLGYTTDINGKLEYTLDEDLNFSYNTAHATTVRVHYGTINFVKENWHGHEGVVFYGVTDDGETVLSKIKSDWYMRMHSFKYSLTKDKVRRFCYFNKINSLEQFKDELFKKGFDEELVSMAEEYFNNYKEVYEKAVDTVKHMRLCMDLCYVMDMTERKKQIEEIKDIVNRNYTNSEFTKSLIWLGICILSGAEELYIGCTCLDCSLSQFNNLKNKINEEWL